MKNMLIKALSIILSVFIALLLVYYISNTSNDYDSSIKEEYYHLHEPLYYKHRGRAKLDTLCVTKGELYKNGTHIVVPSHLDSLVTKKLNGNITFIFKKPDI